MKLKLEDLGSNSDLDFGACVISGKFSLRSFPSLYSEVNNSNRVVVMRSE